MMPGSFRFDRFTLDPVDRRLRRDDVSVELNARYFDALALLVREAGKLVSKDRFLDEVWRGVPVTDEALTQCIKTLRRQLGDDAARPRFIETVPKHGYRFIAPVAGASQPLAPGMGAASVLLVLLWLTMAAALMGGAGVSFGLAAAGFVSGRPWVVIVGGALGGLAVGGVVKLVGLDAFNLLFGRSPGDITGAIEGVVLGGAVGLGAWLGSRGAEPPSLRRSVALAGLVAAAAGILIPLLGRRLMGGSLDLFARGFPGSRLRLDPIGGLFGESGFGPISQAVSGGLEGALFGGCIVAAMLLARRGLGGSP